MAETYTDLFCEQPFLSARDALPNYKKNHYMITAFAIRLLSLLQLLMVTTFK